MGASNSRSGAKGGGDWQWKVYFDPEADATEGPDYRIDVEDLKERMEELIEGGENIKLVRAYKCPLFDWQLTQNIMNHQFVMFETEEWWWSVEKNTEGITIQRSKEPEFVKDRYRRTERPMPLYKLNEDEGRRTLKQLIDYLYEKDELYQEYSWINENCKHFAKRIFDEIAATKWL